MELDLVEVLLDVEDRFEIHLDDGEFTRCVTVGFLRDLVVEKLRAQERLATGDCRCLFPAKPPRLAISPGPCWHIILRASASTTVPRRPAAGPLPKWRSSSDAFWRNSSASSADRITSDAHILTDLAR
jgi:hypothetical protein